jgi:tetratricopeptide (TPR) repeat protein
VLQLKPGYTEAHYNLGVALATQGKLAEAIPHFDRVLQLKPNFAEAHLNLAIALASDGKTAEAIPHFQQALNLAAGLWGKPPDVGSYKKLILNRR